MVELHVCLVIDLTPSALAVLIGIAFVRIRARRSQHRERTQVSMMTDLGAQHSRGQC